MGIMDNTLAKLRGGQAFQEKRTERIDIMSMMGLKKETPPTTPDPKSPAKKETKDEVTDEELAKIKKREELKKIREEENKKRGR